MDWPKTPGRDSRRSGAFDITWPYRDRHMMDFLAHATGNGTVDAHALPAELADKRRRRSHLHTPYPPIDWRRPTAHPGWRYTRSERRTLRAAVVRWPASRQDLTTYANRDILEAEWDTRFGNDEPEHAGAAALVWREPNVAATAYSSAESARHSRLWKTDFLDAHNARLDIDAVMARIVATAHRLWRTHADTPLHLGATDTDNSWTALLSTVDQLTDYARALNGRADLLLAYREVLRLENVDDTAIRIEFGLPLDDTSPLNRSALDLDLNVELTGRISQLSKSALFDDQEDVRPAGARDQD